MRKRKYVLEIVKTTLSTILRQKSKTCSPGNVMLFFVESIQTDSFVSVLQSREVVFDAHDCYI